ncbi:MAG: GYD domain-containing protein, partial [Acidimicrobiales bacterium]
MKYITLLKLTPKGREHLPEAKDILTKVTGVTEQFGGKLESVWATGGQYDFIAVAKYPNPEVAFKARVKLAELGYFVL